MSNVDKATKEQAELESLKLQGHGVTFYNLFEHLISIITDSA